MDLAFSGLMSAAKDCKAPLPDVCFSLQETAFAMCVEVTERALSLAGKNEVLLVGGVGANRRLQEMLRTMCEDRGAKFFVPEQRYLGDNGAMIAYTGKLMLESGVSLPIGSSQVNPSFRSDEVEVPWRKDTPSPGRAPDPGADRQQQGAEAMVTFRDGIAEKRRVSKRYRVPSLDRRLIAERTRAEARLIHTARRAGVPTPVIQDITADTIVMERIIGIPLTLALTEANLREAGRMVGKLHTAGLMHGDLTTSNLIVRASDNRCVLIDFGLAQVSQEIEQRGVDIHVLYQTLESTAPDQSDALKAAFNDGYAEAFEGAAEVTAREHDIVMRGRYH
jgi:N6-L-threonylcarbamoyladenine synthase/protein kinase Bud32